MANSTQVRADHSWSHFEVLPQVVGIGLLLAWALGGTYGALWTAGGDAGWQPALLLVLSALSLLALWGLLRQVHGTKREKEQGSWDREEEELNLLTAFCGGLLKIRRDGQLVKLRLAAGPSFPGFPPPGMECSLEGVFPPCFVLPLQTQLEAIFSGGQPRVEVLPYSWDSEVRRYRALIAREGADHALVTLIDVTEAELRTQRLLSARDALEHARDESERKVQQMVQLTEELEEERNSVLEAHRLQSECLATISHEIRTPLNGILGM